MACIQRGQVDPSDRLTHNAHIHSIAFKPAESGWGAGKKYEQNYDNIFGKKKKEELPKGEGRPLSTDAKDD